MNWPGIAGGSISWEVGVIGPDPSQHSLGVRERDVSIVHEQTTELRRYQAADDIARMNELERGNRGIRRVNEIPPNTSAYFAEAQINRQPI